MVKKVRELEMGECTFKPNLCSHQDTKRSHIPIHQRLAQKAEEVKKHIEEIKK